MEEYQGKHGRQSTMAVDCMIQEYVDEYINEIFKGYEERLKVSTKDMDVAKEVLTTIATIKVYNKLNSIETKPENASDSLSSRIQYFIKYSLNKAKVKHRVVKGYKKDYSGLVLKSRGYPLTDPKIFAKECDDRMLNRLSINTFFEIGNVIHEAVCDLRTVLDHNGSISENYDLESPFYLYLQKQAEFQREEFRIISREKGINNLKSLPREKIDFWVDKWIEKNGRKSNIVELKPNENSEENVVYLDPKPITYLADWQKQHTPPMNNNEAFGLPVPPDLPKNIERDDYRRVVDSLELEDAILRFSKTSTCKALSGSRHNEKEIIESLSQILLKAKYLTEKLPPEQLEKELSKSLYECMKEIQYDKRYNHLTQTECFKLIDQAAMEIQKNAQTEGNIEVGKHYVSRQEGALSTPVKNAIMYAAPAVGAIITCQQSYANNIHNIVESFPIWIGVATTIGGTYLVDLLSRVKKTSLKQRYNISEQQLKELNDLIDTLINEADTIKKPNRTQNNEGDLDI